MFGHERVRSSCPDRGSVKAFSCQFGLAKEDIFVIFKFELIKISQTKACTA